MLSEKINENSTLPDYVFAGLFKNSNIVVAPNFYIKNIPKYAFQNMFRNSQLQEVTNDFENVTIDRHSFGFAFQNCRNLKRAPNIIGTRERSEYSGLLYIFHQCKSLKEAPIINIGNSFAAYTCSGAFLGCTALIDASKINIPTTVSNDSCESMFQDCSNLEIAPIINTRETNTNSFHRIFKNCSKLKEITAYIENATEVQGTTEWLAGTAENGTFYTPSANNWGEERSTSLIPPGWERVDI